MFALALLAWLDISVLAEISNLWIPAKWPWNMASTLKHYILLAEWGKKSSFFQKLKKKKKRKFHKQECAFQDEWYSYFKLEKLF